jgi:hypothetical protein
VRDLQCDVGACRRKQTVDFGGELCVDLENDVWYIPDSGGAF